MSNHSPVAFDLVFHGTVQGVGFRYSAFELARGYPGLAGWVRNEYDGTVQMHVQGPAELIEQYLAEITQTSRLARLIDKVHRKTGTVIPGAGHFRIER